MALPGNRRYRSYSHSTSGPYQEAMSRQLCIMPNCHSQTLFTEQRRQVDKSDYIRDGAVLHCTTLNGMFLRLEILPVSYRLHTRE